MTESVAQFFDAKVATHGTGPLAADWGSAASQEARFALFARLEGFPGASLLDVGCGQGDLLRFLRRTGKAPATYTGWDVSPAMLESARSLEPGIEVNLRDIRESTGSRTHDWVVFSGSLNRGFDPAGMEDALRRGFDLCRTGLAASILSTWADRIDADYSYADPLRLLTFARTLSRRVRLDHLAMTHDVLLVIRREESP